MNEAYFRAFQRTINGTVYRYASQGEFLCQKIEESDYQFDLVFKVHAERAVIFRLENIKELAKYLLGGKRSAGKDNDCTIIDDAVYLIEVKYTKKTRNSQIKPQIAGGKRWLNHLLSLVVKDDDALKKAAEMPIYHLVIVMRRTGLSRSAHAQSARFGTVSQASHYRIEIPKGTRHVDLTKSLSFMRQHQANDEFKLLD